MSKIKIQCDICEKEIEVNYCCDGNNGCGCGGITDPPVCSEECFDKYINQDKPKNSTLEELIQTVERWSENNTTTLTNVKLFAKSWRAEHNADMEELLKEIENLENLFQSDYALEENGYNRAISDCRLTLVKYFFNIS